MTSPKYIWLEPDSILFDEIGSFLYDRVCGTHDVHRHVRIIRLRPQVWGPCSILALDCARPPPAIDPVLERKY